MQHERGGRTKPIREREACWVEQAELLRPGSHTTMTLLVVVHLLKCHDGPFGLLGLIVEKFLSGEEALEFPAQLNVLGLLSHRI